MLLLSLDVGVVLRGVADRRSCSKRLVSNGTAFFISDVISIGTAFLIPDVHSPLFLLAEEIFVFLLHIPFPEAVSWMEKIQDQDGDDNHGPFKPDEEMLVLDQSTRPPLTQFSDPIDRTYKDAESRQRQRDQEDSKLQAASQRRMLRIQGRVAHGPHPP